MGYVSNRHEKDTTIYRRSQRPTAPVNGILKDGQRLTRQKKADNRRSKVTTNDSG
jgi:hypothetical protein